MLLDLEKKATGYASLNDGNGSWSHAWGVKESSGLDKRFPQRPTVTTDRLLGWKEVTNGVPQDHMVFLICVHDTVDRTCRRPAVVVCMGRLIHWH